MSDPVVVRFGGQQFVGSDGCSPVTFHLAVRYAAAALLSVLQIIKTPVQAPRANAIAERWVASARRECMDRMHLRLVLGEYVDHYNTHRRTGHCNRIRPPGVRIHLRK